MEILMVNDQWPFQVLQMNSCFFSFDVQHDLCVFEQIGVTFQHYAVLFY